MHQPGGGELGVVEFDPSQVAEPLEVRQPRVCNFSCFEVKVLQMGQLLEMCQPGCSGSSICYAVIIDSPIWTMINTALTIAIASPNRVLAGDCPFVKPKLAMLVSINWTGMLRNNSFTHVD